MKYLFTIFLSILFTTFFTFNQSFAQVSTSTINICQVLYSIDVYTVPNLGAFQSYFKKTFFPKIKITSQNDSQMKYYIGKFQYAFGLKPTGILNTETIKFLKETNKCFDLEKRVVEIQNATPTIRVTTQDIILNLINTYILGNTSTSPSPVTVTATTTSN